MPDDPIFRLAKLRAIRDCQEIENQLSGVHGARPVVTILHKAKMLAAEAMTALAAADAEEPKIIRALQNKILLYDELCNFVKEIIAAGMEYDREITVEDREELLDSLWDSPEGEREAIELGLIDPHPQADS